jgi:hypothetical protein
MNQTFNPVAHDRQTALAPEGKVRCPELAARRSGYAIAPSGQFRRSLILIVAAVSP